MATGHTAKTPPYQIALEAKDVRDAFAAAPPLQVEEESIFAMRMLVKSKAALDAATRHPDGVRQAMLRLADLRLSLNPISQLAALVEQDGAIHLDVGYRGLLRIAIEEEAIQWGRVETIYANDHFVYHGPTREPEHRPAADPFSDGPAVRGPRRGVVVLTRTRDGHLLADLTSAADIEALRALSPAYHTGTGRWFDPDVEPTLWKKIAVMRAAALWPAPAHTDRLIRAMHYAALGECACLPGMESNAQARARAIQAIRAWDQGEDALVAYGASVLSQLKGSVEEIDEVRGVFKEKRLALQASHTASATNLRVERTTEGAAAQAAPAPDNVPLEARPSRRKTPSSASALTA